jgi:hypothetical protein
MNSAISSAIGNLDVGGSSIDEDKVKEIINNVLSTKSYATISYVNDEIGKLTKVNYDTIYNQMINKGLVKSSDVTTQLTNYLPKSGGTIEGGLTITGNLSTKGSFTHGSDMSYKTIVNDIEIDLDTIANAPVFAYA